MGILYVALSAFGGGVVSALLGWFESGEAFVARKFGSSMLRAVLAGAVFAVGYTYMSSVVAVPDVLCAFLAGAGVDVLGNRLAGSIKK